MGEPEVMCLVKRVFLQQLAGIELAPEEAQRFTSELPCPVK